MRPDETAGSPRRSPRVWTRAAAVAAIGATALFGLDVYASADRGGGDSDAAASSSMPTKAYVFSYRNDNTWPSSKSFDLPRVPAGAYQVSIQAGIQTFDDSPEAYCDLFQENGDPVLVEGHSEDAIWVSGAGSITTTPGESLSMDCGTSGFGSWRFIWPLKVTLLRLDEQVKGQLDPTGD